MFILKYKCKITNYQKYREILNVKKSPSADKIAIVALSLLANTLTLELQTYIYIYIYIHHLKTEITKRLWE